MMMMNDHDVISFGKEKMRCEHGLGILFNSENTENSLILQKIFKKTRRCKY